MNSNSSSRDMEHKVFLILTSVVLVIRIVAIFFFFRQVIKYNRQKKEDKDPFTTATFVLFGISIFFIFFNRFFEVVYDFSETFGPS